MYTLCIAKVLFPLFGLLFSAPSIGGRFPCLNDGEPVLPEGSEFTCKCTPGFVGPLCQYQDTSERHPQQQQHRTIDQNLMNLLLCVFFLLILPTLIIYLLRTLYLSLKRCRTLLYHQHQHHHLCEPQSERLRAPSHSALLSRQLHAMSERHAISAGNATQLQSRPCRRGLLHGTQSLTIHDTIARLSTGEFNDVLLRLHRDLEHLRQQVPLAPVHEEAAATRPPPYESVVRHTTSLRFF